MMGYTAYSVHMRSALVSVSFGDVGKETGAGNVSIEDVVLNFGLIS